MMQPATIQTIACGSTNPKTIRAAAEFPARLYAVHGINIQLRDTAVYFGNGTSKGSKGKGIDVSCTICGHEWSPVASNILRGNGCPECKRLGVINSAGKLRQSTATPEEKQRAIELRVVGVTYRAIGKQLLEEGLSLKLRSPTIIRCWTNPTEAEKHRQRSAKWKEENREHHLATKRRYHTEFSHGRASKSAGRANYRLLKTNTPEYVFLDGEWHEVDRKETWRVFSEILLPTKERKEIQELYLEAQYQTEVTGVEHHVDHIQPLSKGGDHLMYNLQILTAKENLSKNDTFREEDQIELAKQLFG
jgi:hypothetical protein